MKNSSDKTIERVLQASRRKLLDTGTRNRLVHINRANQRGNFLNVINEKSEEIYGLLRISGKRMRFKAMGKDKTGEGHEMVLAVPDVGLSENSNRLTDNFIETPLGPDALARRLLRLAGNAKTAEEEQGLNILYLAIGFLHWKEGPKSDVQRHSPLILLPVQLVRNERTSTFDILCRDDDITTNLPLQERLRQDFGVILPEVEEEDGFLPSTYFEQVEESVSGQSGWSVDPDGMQLGFFSFAKLLMHRDLNPSNWPNGVFAENPLLKGLLSEGFPEETPLFSVEDKLDDLLDPAEIIQVIDADASQTKVIEEVRRGSSLVVQGPPGTGKSQTITNIIAAAAHDGKSVLFVAEKMAALSVVHDRLVRAGLRDVCLELHSRTANKKALAQELGRTLMASAKAMPVATDPARLRATRDELNRISSTLHDPLPLTGDTPFLAISEIVGFIGKGAPPPSIPTSGLEALDETRRLELIASLGLFVSALDRAGLPAEHPFRGTRLLDLQPTDLTRLEVELAEALAAHDCLYKLLAEVVVFVRTDLPQTLLQVPDVIDRLKLLAAAPQESVAWVERLYEHAEDPALSRAIDIGVELIKEKTAISDIVAPTAWGHDLKEIKSALYALPENLLKSIPSDLSDIQVYVIDALDRFQGLRKTLERLTASLLQPKIDKFEQIPHLLKVQDAILNAPDRSREIVPIISQVGDKARLREVLDAGAKWHSAYQSVVNLYSDEAWTTDLSFIRSALTRGKNSFLYRTFGGYRRASANLSSILLDQLPEDPAGRIALVTQLGHVQDLRRRLADDEEWLREKLELEWRGERTAFGDLIEVLDWLQETGRLGNFDDADAVVKAIETSKSVTRISEELFDQTSASKQDLVALDLKLKAKSSKGGEAFLCTENSLTEIEANLQCIAGYHSASCELHPLLTGGLPASALDRLALVEKLSKIQDLHSKLEQEEPVLQSVLQAGWNGETTPFLQLKTIIVWLRQVQKTKFFSSSEHLKEALIQVPRPEEASLAILAAVAACRAGAKQPISRLDFDLNLAGLNPSIDAADLFELNTAFAKMASDLSRYQEWVDLTQSMYAVEKFGAGKVIDAVLKSELAPSRAVEEFSYACAEARWNAARAARPELNLLPQINRHGLVTLFGELEKDRIQTAKTLILSRHFEQMPRGTMGEMGVIRGEIGRKRGHKPIRWIMKKAGSMVQRIKPVMLMSPISVAQFLPSDTIMFDLLVIDEASQIRPEDALGVIARARQIVVVGDQKQLPPTSFFDRLVDDLEEIDEDEEEELVGASAADMESILSLCEARGLRQRMLEWHYRSRDPSLIQVSNAEFYGDGLVLPPSPLQLDDDYGLKFRRVPGAYARGGKGGGRQGTNRIEAEEVAKAVAEHARSWPDLSLGVVTFSKTQADMMAEVLELHRRQDSVLDAFLREGQAEDFFVKNIENVQGDERDVIMISVGYGPMEPNGRLASMSFGPINSEGGERRLNVLFSRARVRCEVFASFDPSDIDPSRSTREGPRVLKRFLDFAKTGIMETQTVTGHSANSPFEGDVARVIESLGYLADPQVGTDGFRVDIGVRHPERPSQYLVAVECDGEAYHSAPWARERDRLRQGILENLGWNFHRIWITDWFRNRDREVEKLKEILDTACISSAEGVRVSGANLGSKVYASHEEENSAPEVLEIEHLKITAPAYAKASFSIKSPLQPHEVPLHFLADLITKIIEVEGPIHEDEVARRVTAAFGLSRTGKRIVEATNEAIRSVTDNGHDITKKGTFLCTLEQSNISPVRDRSNETGTCLKAEYLSEMEIAAAAEKISSESGGMTPEEMTKAVAKILGYQRVGPDLSSRIMSVLI